MKAYRKSKEEKRVKKKKKVIDSLIKNIIKEASDVSFSNITTAYEGSETSLMILVQQLNEGGKFEINYTISAINECNEKLALVILILLVENPNLANSAFKEQIAQSIIEVGTSAVPHLCEVLNNRYLWDSAIVVKILGDIGDNRALPSLFEMLEKEDEKIRHIAVDAIMEIGDNTAVPSLCQALQDKSKDVRMEVAKGLGDLGDFRALNPLQNAMESRYIDAHEREVYKHSIELIMKSRKSREYQIHQANNYTLAGKYDEAIEIYESLGMWKDAGRTRELGQLTQQPIQNQYFIENVDLSNKSETKIIDSVLNRSNIITDIGETPTLLTCSNCGYEITSVGSPSTCPHCNVIIDDSSHRRIQNQQGDHLSTRNVTEFEYDIAISYASEDREHVDEYAKLLLEYGVKVFYDQTNQAELWGKDLNENLPDIYSKKAKYCVMFISKNYLKKWWTERERLSAQLRNMDEGNDYLLPIKLDESEILGMPPSVVYIDMREVSTDDIVSITLERLGKK